MQYTTQKYAAESDVLIQAVFWGIAFLRCDRSIKDEIAVAFLPAGVAVALYTAIRAFRRAGGVCSSGLYP